VFGVVAAQRNELLADGTAAVCLALAAFRVLDNALHLLAGRQGAVGVATLTRVDQRLDAALDAEAPRISRTLGGCSRRVVAVIVQSEPQLIHLVLMTFDVVASDAQVIVLEKEGKREGDGELNLNPSTGLKSCETRKIKLVLCTKLCAIKTPSAAAVVTLRADDHTRQRLEDGEVSCPSCRTSSSSHGTGVNPGAAGDSMCAEGCTWCFTPCTGQKARVELAATITSIQWNKPFQMGLENETHIC